MGEIVGTEQVVALWTLACAHGHWWASAFADVSEIRAKAWTEEGITSLATEHGSEMGGVGFPTADGDGVRGHTTGTGRLQWSVALDGTVELSIWRLASRIEVECDRELVVAAAAFEVWDAAVRAAQTEWERRGAGSPPEVAALRDEVIHRRTEAGEARAALSHLDRPVCVARAVVLGGALVALGFPAAVEWRHQVSPDAWRALQSSVLALGAELDEDVWTAFARWKQGGA